MFYSKTTGGFYAAEIHGDNMPADVVEITAEEHAYLLAGQSAGGVISADNTGKPIIAGPSRRNIADVIEKKIASIEQWRQQEESSEIIFEYNGRQWDAGQVTRSRIEPVLGLEVLPDNFYWTDANNEDVPVTKEEIKSLYQAMLTAMVDRGFSIHRRQREMKQLVSLMTRVRDVDDFVVGW